MKTTRKLLTMLLVLALLLSLAVTVSAQEEGENAPYLSSRFLENQEEGWYEVMDRDPFVVEDGVTSLDWIWRVFYLNTWNEETGEWESEPVMVETDHPDLTIEKVADLGEEEHIREGEENADYFCKITSANSMEHRDTEVYYMYNGEKVAMPFRIYAREAGFYTTDTPSIESAILTWDYQTDVLREENSFYYIFRSGYWQEVEGSFFYWVTTWDENQEMVRVEGEAANDFITVEPKGNGVYKIIVNPDFVRMTTGNWANFEVVCGVGAEGDEEDTTTFERGIWINPSGSHDNAAARFSIDGREYMFYEDSDIVGTWEPQYEENGDPVLNDWGDHVHYWTETQLPEGVSYNLATNTLTLNNAHLENIYADYHWANRNENGEINIRDDGTLEEGWNLPNPDLKINLKGNNEIVCGYESALNLNNELNVTINGTGSLLAKAINSTENTRTEYHWDGENEVEMEVYHCFDAIHVNNGSNLTIAGNAKVTAEIVGAAYETEWDENGPTDRYRNAFLSAVRVHEGDLTLKDNAKLTTVLPEDARDNGPAIDGEFSGGYRGVEYFRNLTIQDKATLTTSSLYVSNGWEWNEETGRDEITWTGTYNQTGGTVNITALGSYGKNMTDDGELIDHYNYNGLGTDFGEINISGGTLNVTANATDEEFAVSAWAEAIGVGEGTLNISGGTVNAEARYGSALGIRCGDATVSGGKVNLTVHEGTALVVGDWGDDPENGYVADGKLTVTDGEVNIDCADGVQAGCAVEIHATSWDSSISGGSIHVENGCFDIYGGFAINGGEVYIEAISEAPGWIVFGTNDVNAELTMTAGKLNVNTTNFLAAMVNNGTFRQTGGDVVLNADVEEEWYADYPAMDVIGMLNVGRAELSGGSLTANGAMAGFMEDLLFDVNLDDDGNPVVVVPENQGLVVKDDAVLNATGLHFGMFIRGPVEIQGGQVHAVATDAGTGDENFALAVRVNSSAYIGEYGTEDGDVIPYEVGNHTSFSITGGTHSFIAPTNAPINAGLMIFDSPVNIENATVKIVGGRGLLEARLADDGSALTGSYYVISLKNGEELERFAHTVVDESGDEPITDHLYLFTEDNKAPAEDANEMAEINFATELLILPDNKCGEKATWKIKDGVLTISGEGAMYDYAPDFANGKTSAPWSPVKHAITKVVVEEGITEIGDWAFAWLDEMTHVSYPASMTNIGKATVTRTDKLAGYTVASGNKHYATPDDISIVELKSSTLLTVAMAAPGKTYTVPKNVKVIGENALILCGFEEVIIPEGVTELKNAVFEGCAKLKTVNIPKSVTKLGEAVFVGCDNVTVTVYCNTAGADYVKSNKINSKVTHEFAEATCTEPKTCKVCKTAEGEKLGHKWGEWVTGEDGVKTRTCSVCKDTETDDPEEPSKPSVSDCGKDASCALSKYVDLVATDWYHDGIHYCIDEGLMNGMSENTFEAGGYTTRAQLVTILYRAAGQPDITGLTEPFTDVVETDWYYKSIVWAYNNQVVNGMTADTFGPNGNVTREQVATILYRYTGSPAVSGSLAAFPDVANVSGYAQIPMVWATGEGLINGVMQPDGTSLLDPTGNATRAQIATILMRYLTNG